MLTNNFLTLSKCVMLGSDVDKTINLKIKNLDNNEYYLKPAYSGAYPTSDNSHYFNYTPASAGWSVGAGSTPASVDDYKLEEPITSNSVINGNASVTTLNDTENNKVIKRCTVNVTNISNSNVTINEIGLKQGISASTTINTPTSLTVVVLIYRHVLSEPVILEPAKGVTFIIDFYIDT